MSELTYPQAQQGGIILADPDRELCSLCDGLGNPVVDATVKLEDNQVVLLLAAGIRHIPETQEQIHTRKLRISPCPTNSMITESVRTAPHPVRFVLIRGIDVSKSSIIPYLKIGDVYV